MNKLKTLLGILCLLVGNTPFAQTTEREPSSTSPDAALRLPEFSWDTLPLYIHIRKREKFTDEELQYLAGFPLITLEKTCLLYTSPSPRDATLSRMPSSA